MDRGAATDKAGNIASAVEGALAWWRAAGVDRAYADTATAWLAPDAAETPPAAAPPAAAPPPAPPTPQLGGARASWPAELAGFAPWWLTEPALGPAGGRVPPRGVHGAELMILVAEPEADDTDRLLAGPQGRLLDALLAAMGVAPERAYVASLLPRHTPMADWAQLARQGLGEIARHHVALAAPRRLIAFGGNILPLLGNAPAQSAANLNIFNHEGVQLPLLAERDLASLLGRPRAKAALWQRWLEWTA